MLFNSLDFAIFFPIVFICYWFIFNKSLKLQNGFLLAASYFFYSCWDWRFLFLLMFSTLLDFYTGQKIYNLKSTDRKIWLWVSIATNLGFLILFKYFNFFIDSFSNVFSILGYTFSGWSLNVILPVGISFYTFHGLSYVVDIYNDRTKPVSNFINYSVFVSFFPLLVAGPIERATHLLPQIEKKRHFDYNLAVNGLRQLLWGLFKKLVIADNCAQYANQVFNDQYEYSGSSLALGAVFFAFQIYGDFSGYTDMASGVAKILGIRLLKNFSYPYFSRDIAEFWRRWHISLSSWFRDYVYIPLGGSRVSLLKQVRNVFIVFLLSGFWHGANWTFIVWGLLHACYFLPSLLIGTNRSNIDNDFTITGILGLKNLSRMAFTFLLVTIGWIFFRSDSLTLAIDYIAAIFSNSLFTLPHFLPKKLILLTVAFIVVEWYGRKEEFAIAKMGLNWSLAWRISFYYMILILILIYITTEQDFIYFQF